ncbi:MAG: cupin domain-containing protein [Cyclobacteriaceae bacterium]|nr:cupin domain-containing protein [Cyclobacteriaceae bacterium]
METITKPAMTVAQVGDKFKVFKVTGSRGAEMPSHISTKEAVVVVQYGEAILTLQGKEIHLKTNDSAIIPAQAPHTLLIEEDFESYVIMGNDSEIQFTNQ